MDSEASQLTWYAAGDTEGECSYCGEEIEPGQAADMRRLFAKDEGGTDIEARLHGECFKDGKESAAKAGVDYEEFRGPRGMTAP